MYYERNSTQEERRREEEQGIDTDTDDEVLLLPYITLFKIVYLSTQMLVEQCLKLV